MRWHVTLLPINDYKPKELIQKEYFKNNIGDFFIAATFFDTESTIFHLIHFLFQTEENPAEVYRDSENYILDLSAFKNSLIQIKDLEFLYPDWLRLTGRESSMDEYGKLIDFVVFGHTENKRHLLMIVSKQPK